MPKTIAQGDVVRVQDREATPADVRSQLFYPHFRGLVGTVVKIYPDQTAAVTMDLESLPAEVRARHESGSDTSRRKWLDGLSDEARNRLSAAEKKYALNYTILVSVDDLHPADRRAPVQAVLDIEAEPARKSIEDLEAAEARHLDEVARKKRE